MHGRPGRPPASAALAAFLLLLGAAGAASGGQAPPPYGQAPYAPDPAYEQAENDLARLKLQYDAVAKAGLETDASTPIATIIENRRQQTLLLDQIIQLAVALGTGEETQYQAKREQVIRERRELEAALAKKNAEERQKAELLTRARQSMGQVPPNLAQAQALLTKLVALDPRNAEARGLLAFVARELWNQWILRVVGWSIAGIVATVAAGLGFWAFRTRARGAVLEMLEGPQPGERVRIDREVFVLGAAQDADWSIPDPARRISRRHCEISRSGRRYFVTDTSTNGTRVNGEFTTSGEPVLLRRGDQIALADDVILKFR
jgi:hypothetical protein